MDLEMFTVNLIAYLMNSAMQKAGLAMDAVTNWHFTRENKLVYISHWMPNLQEGTDDWEFT